MPEKRLHLSLYQPDIPQNVGAAIRLCACLDMGLDIIEPCGFPWNDRKIRQSAMDYIDLLTIDRFSSWDNFQNTQKNKKRIILMTTKAAMPYTEFNFEAGDILLAGQESLGVPEHIHNEVDARIYVPMNPNARSLNVVNASAIILSEAQRQINLKD